MGAAARRGAPGGTTKIGFEEFQRLRQSSVESESYEYELDEGVDRQYLAAGSEAVWRVCLELRIMEIHDAAGNRDLTESEPISEERLFPGRTFHLSLTALLDDDPER